MRRSRSLSRLLVAISTVALVAGCGTAVSGRAVSVFEDPFKVGGLEASDGPTGLRANPKPESREVTGTDGGAVDSLAGQSVSDLEEFWRFAYPDTFDGELTPVSALYSWDSNDYDGEFCDEITEGLVNAGFCEQDNSIGWDRTVLMPSLRKAYGDMAITMVLAHEYGHALQKQATLNPRGVPTLVAEQQADCLAGAYMRWVAEGKSPRFTLSTGEGLNNLLAAMISFRDPLLSENDYYNSGDEHGSAFERISAFQFGFTDGAAACATITLKEIKERRGDLPVELPTRPDRGTARHRGLGQGPRRRAEPDVRPQAAARAELRRRRGLDVPRRQAQPAGVVLPGVEHHHRGPSGAAGDRRSERGL